MRMFLVGMCDIFLLLYLTALAQLDARQVSSLTVQDYVKLQQTSADVERRKSEAEARLAQREASVNELRLELAALKEQARQAGAARDRTAAEREQARAKLADVQKIAADRERLAGESERRRTELEAQLALLRQAAERDQQNRLQAQAEAEKARQEAEAARKAAEEARRLAEEARAEQERAQSMAQAALEREAQALGLRQQAEAEALQARLTAEQAAELAAEASRDRSQARARLNAVTQPASTAFHTHVSQRIVPVAIELRVQGMFGTRAEEITVQAVPVAFGSEQIAFVPWDQAGLESVSDPETLVSFTASVDGHPVRKVYVTHRAPFLIGLAVERTPVAVAPVIVPGLSGYMPTLIAVRNGAPMRFKDRIRSMDQGHFLFQRDRLRMNTDGSFTYDAAGFRGTGDYAEYLVKGDQIVDLEGNFVGVVGLENTITPVRAVAHWLSASLSGDGFRQVLREVVSRSRL